MAWTESCATVDLRMVEVLQEVVFFTAGRKWKNVPPWWFDKSLQSATPKVEHSRAYSRVPGRALSEDVKHLQHPKQVTLQDPKFGNWQDQTSY